MMPSSQKNRSSEVRAQQSNSVLLLRLFELYLIAEPPPRLTREFFVRGGVQGSLEVCDSVIGCLLWTNEKGFAQKPTQDWWRNGENANTALYELLCGADVNGSPKTESFVVNGNSCFPKGITAIRVTEVEAYIGIDDPASHAFGGKKTPRTSAMYAEGGSAYVYLCYGIHTMLNISTGPAGQPSVFLLRGGLPVLGYDSMLARRGLAPLSLACDLSPEATPRKNRNVVTAINAVSADRCDSVSADCCDSVSAEKSRQKPSGSEKSTVSSTRRLAGVSSPGPSKKRRNAHSATKVPPSQTSEKLAIMIHHVQKLAQGPGRVAQALGIVQDYNKEDCTSENARIWFTQPPNLHRFGHWVIEKIKELWQLPTSITDPPRNDCSDIGTKHGRELPAAVKQLLSSTPAELTEALTLLLFMPQQPVIQSRSIKNNLRQPRDSNSFDPLEKSLAVHQVGDVDFTVLDEIASFRHEETAEFQQKSNVSPTVDLKAELPPLSSTPSELSEIYRNHFGIETVIHTHRIGIEGCGPAAVLLPYRVATSRKDPSVSVLPSLKKVLEKAHVLEARQQQRSVTRRVLENVRKTTEKGG